MTQPSEEPKARQGGSREFPRFAAKIPAQIEVIHAWQGTSAGPFSGELYNVSRGGAGLRLDRVFPPRTRLRIAIPSMLRGERLSAEVVWTSALVREPASGPAVYGVRWLEELSRLALEAIIPEALRQEEHEAGAQEPAS